MLQLLKRYAHWVAATLALFALLAVSYPHELYSLLLDNSDRTIAVATWVLAVFAMLQWGVTRDAAQRQLRAYVFVRQHEEIPVSWGNSFTFTAMLVLQNYGQTPAHDVRHWACLGVRDLPHNEKSFSRRESTVRAVLPPGGHVDIPLEELKVHPDEWQAIFDGRKGVYVWGEVLYRDAFGHEQVTRYRLVASGLKARKHGALEICSEGNEAT